MPFSCGSGNPCKVTEPLLRIGHSASPALLVVLATPAHATGAVVFCIGILIARNDMRRNLFTAR